MIDIAVLAGFFIVENPSYYLLGTLVNLSIAVLSVLAAKVLVVAL
jgi:hypothetical protein